MKMFNFSKKWPYSSYLDAEKQDQLFRGIFNGTLELFLEQVAVKVAVINVTTRLLRGGPASLKASVGWFSWFLLSDVPKNLHWSHEKLSKNVLFGYSTTRQTTFDNFFMGQRHVF